jgi:hypothetical protein
LAITPIEVMIAKRFQLSKKTEKAGEQAFNSIYNLRIKTLAEAIKSELTTNSFSGTTWLPDNQVNLKVTIKEW